MNALTQDYKYVKDVSEIRFKVHNIKLAPSEAPTGSFEFQVSTFDSGTYYLVDTATASNLFQATRAALGSASVSTDSLMSDKLSTYTFGI